MRITYKSLLLLGLIVLVVTMIGCGDYNAPTAMYYQDQPDHTNPVISEIVPADVAPAGANTITILGSNFKSDSSNVYVYFDNVMVDIISASATELVVRRPNIVSTSSTVKVVSDDALVVVKQENYQIDAVIESYGSFLDGNRLSALALDANENLYVVQRVPRTVFRVPPNGEEKEVIGEASRVVTDAKIGPSGKLILLMNNKSIEQMDVTTGEETEWVAVSKRVSFGDFDINGNFFCAGNKSDVFVVHPDLSSTNQGMYSLYDILSVRVFNGYVYVLGENTNPAEGEPAVAVWRNKILDVNGTLGDIELVLDWSTTSDLAEYSPLYLAFDVDGTLYIGSDAPDPIFMLTPDGSYDIMYKEIISSTAEILVWGNGNYLYQLLGGSEWDIKRIDMGKAGAPYYGRSL